ncbi:MAG: RnfABCDGE type electron transport complex subunit D [Spirochaetales bacterium]|nr:RnfABCDGE type electron transport complex subunit D [Spirochaetales bacterium]
MSNQQDAAEKNIADTIMAKPMMTVSSSPHILNDDTTVKIMWTVGMFLIPIAAFGIYLYGLYSLVVVLTSVVTAIVAEMICLALRRRSVMTAFDGSAFLTGLLIGMNMPPSIPLYIPIISTIFAIGLVKQAFGGLGQNWANPAIAGRVFALMSWTKQMTTWQAPLSRPFTDISPDVVTTATPLGAVKSVLLDGGVDLSATVGNLTGWNKFFYGPLQILQTMPNDVFRTKATYFDLFFGLKGGCIGEVSIFLIVLAGLYLIYRKIIIADIPLSYLLTVVLLAWVFDGRRFGLGFFHGDPLFHLLTGGVMLGALFMATDMVTTPVTRKGRVIFGIGCGLLTMLIRMCGGLPEGVSLSILFMNMLSPTIDRFVRIVPMGYTKPPKAPKDKEKGSAA